MVLKLYYLGVVIAALVLMVLSARDGTFKQENIGIITAMAFMWPFLLILLLRK